MSLDYAADSTLFPVFDLHSNPHDTYDDIHPLRLTAGVLVTPHAVSLVIPVGSARTVHASPAHLLGLRLMAYLVGLRTLCLCGCRSCVGEVLYDGAVDAELVLR